VLAGLELGDFGALLDDCGAEQQRRAAAGERGLFSLVQDLVERF
jgi:hypothetical protein